MIISKIVLTDKNDNIIFREQIDDFDIENYVLSNFEDSSKDLYLKFLIKRIEELRLTDYDEAIKINKQIEEQTVEIRKLIEDVKKNKWKYEIIDY